MRKIISFTAALFVLILLAFSNFTEAGSISILVDYGHKSAQPGESVFFIWTITNEDDIYTLDLYIHSEPETIFNTTDFTLRPGEAQIVNQTVHTSILDKNGTKHTIEVFLDGESYIIQPTPGNTNEIGTIGSVVTITIINESDEIEENEQFEFNNSSDKNWIMFIFIPFIVVVVILFIIFYKKKMQ